MTQRKLTGPEIVEYLRNKHRSSPAARQVTDQNHRHFDSLHQDLRDHTRTLFEAWQRKYANAFDFDPRVFTELPASALDQAVRSGWTMNALAGRPDVKLRVDFTSSITINGVPLTDDE